MNPLDSAPKFENRQETAVETYRRVAISRISELVEDGTYPKQYAEDLISNIHLTEEVAVDPEQAGINAAEVGIEPIREFRAMVDASLEQAVEMSNSVLRHFDESWQKIKNREVVPSDIQYFDKVVEKAKQEVEASLAEFKDMVKEVRDLEKRYSTLSGYVRLESALGNLQAILGEVPKE